MDNTNEKIKEYGYSNFTTLKDEWSEYGIEDGTIIRIKTIPLKLFKRGQDYEMRATKALVAFSPISARGSPSNTPLSDLVLQASLDKIDIKFEIIGEPWNEYQLDDGLKVFLKTVVTSISSTNLFDNYGEPVYVVQHQPLIKKYPI
jgi:hypothetical protein